MSGSETGLVILGATVDGVPADARVSGARIVEMTRGAERISPVAGETVIEAHGGALLPGLVDHHLHLLAMARRESSVDCSLAAVGDRDGLAVALRAAVADADGWVRAVNYDEAIAGELDAARVDALRGDVPVRIAHYSGALWVLNTPAMARLAVADSTDPGVERDAAGRPTGRLWRMDRWLGDRLGSRAPVDLAAVGRLLASYGVTEVVDATATLGPGGAALIADACRTGALPQRIRLLASDASRSPDEDRLLIGASKIVLSEHALPGLEELAEQIRALHVRGRAAAVHAVSRESLLLVLAAFDDVGVVDGDRIEHAALVPAEVVGRLRPFRVVTQPGFVADRGDGYRRAVPADEWDDLYRVASLRAAGVRVALSSDAPHGPVDPWVVIRAACDRMTASGAVLGPGERVDARTALAMMLAPSADPGGLPRRIRAGGPADLCLLHVPLDEAFANLSSGATGPELVRHTICAGHLVG